MYNSTISEKTNHHSALFSAIYMLFRNGIWAKCSIKYRESDALFKFGEKKDEFISNELVLVAAFTAKYSCYFSVEDKN